MTTSAGQDVDVLFRKWLLDNFGYLLPEGDTSGLDFTLIIASASGIGGRQKRDAFAVLRRCPGMFHCKDGVITYMEPAQ